MALKKLITKENGIELEYWKIKKIEVENGFILIRTVAYKNQEFRDVSENNVIEKRNFHISNYEPKENIYLDAYNALKEQEFFQDSEDC